MIPPVRFAPVLPLVLLVAIGGSAAVGQTNYPRTGWETHLTQAGHGVKGTATILDERTIRLTHFSYDGLEPDMYVYLGTNQSSVAFLNGWTVSPRLARAYNNETLDVRLPENETLDGWNAISIWCRAVQASFGSGTFAPPNRPSLTITPLASGVAVKLTGEPGQVLAPEQRRRPGDQRLADAGVADECDRHGSLYQFAGDRPAGTIFSGPARLSRRDLSRTACWFRVLAPQSCVRAG
jgi:hypothetical protein